MMVFKRVLITGIDGSTGNYLSNYISENHPEVEIYGIFRKNSFIDKKTSVESYACDLRDSDCVKKVLDKIDFDCVFHLASFAKMNEVFEKPLFVVENNFMGTVNLLEAIRLKKTENKPIFFLASTSKVYGDVPKSKIPMDEKLQLNPKDPYSTSKVAQELLSKAYSENYGIPLVISRAFGYINPKREDLFSSQWAKQIARIEIKLEKKLKHGDLSPIRTFMDIRDVVETMWIIANRGQNGEVYNTGSENPLNLEKILEMMKKKAYCEIETEENQSLTREVDTTGHIPNTKKFRELDINWKPKYSLEESLVDLMNCYRSQTK